MIVTKELAKKYLIKRAAWFIDTSPEGELMMSYRAENWLEGMELFEDEDECYAELERRRAGKMSSGHCPRCNYKHAGETDKDISYLKLLSEPKGSKVYQCPQCRSVWFTKEGWSVAKGYDETLADYIIEWGTRDMCPSPAQKEVLNKIGNISREKHFELYPAHVILKNGKELPAAMIHLETQPPPSNWFDGPKYTPWNNVIRYEWHYFDLIKELKPSEYAYPFEIASAIMKVIAQGKYKMMYVEDQASKKVYSFECHAGIFLPEELRGKDLKLLQGRQPEESKNYFEPHERGGPDLWMLTPPPKPITVWGDL